MNVRRVSELLAASAFACAAIVWGVAVIISASGNDAVTPLVLGDLIAIIAYALGAVTARTPLAIGIAILAVPYFLVDGLLRLFSGAVATDGARPISALTFYQGESLPYPILGCVLILGLSFALRKRAPITWIVALIVSGIMMMLSIIGRDVAMIAALWYVAMAFEWLRTGIRNGRS